MKYRASNLSLPINAGRKTRITSVLSSVDGEEGTTIPVPFMLEEASGPNVGAGIPNKTISIQIQGVEKATVQTDVNGYGGYDYVVDVANDGMALELVFNGD